MSRSHDALASFAVARGAFSAEDCAAIEALLPEGTVSSAAMIPSAQAVGSIRRSSVSWLPESPETAWIAHRLDAVLAACPFDVVIDGREPMQIARYGPGDGYSWHIDLGPGLAAHRKLSLSVLLADRASFGGGEVELGADAGLVPGLEQGDAVVFPSFLRHRVCPVLEGERRSLVAWFTGPPYR